MTVALVSTKSRPRDGRRCGCMQVWLGERKPSGLAISDWVITEFPAALSMKLRSGQIEAIYPARRASDVLGAAEPWRYPELSRPFYRQRPVPHSHTQTKRILASGPCSGCDRIKPTQTAKPRKIPVCGAKRKPMFHSQRGQMSVRDEIAMNARQRQKFAPQLGVPLRWLRYPCRFAGEACLYLPPRIANRFGIFEHARISHQPHESDHAGPRETDRARTVQLLIEPVSRAMGC